MEKYNLNLLFIHISKTSSFIEKTLSNVECRINLRMNLIPPSMIDCGEFWFWQFAVSIAHFFAVLHHSFLLRLSLSIHYIQRSILTHRIELSAINKLIICWQFGFKLIELLKQNRKLTLDFKKFSASWNLIAK